MKRNFGRRLFGRRWITQVDRGDAQGIGLARRVAKRVFTMGRLMVRDRRQAVGFRGRCRWSGKSVKGLKLEW